MHQSLGSLAAVGAAFKAFLGELTYLYHPAWKFGLYHCHELGDSEETAR